MTETTVVWRLPDWAAELIEETLTADAESPAFDLDVRRRIELALESIEEKEGE